MFAPAMYPLVSKLMRMNLPWKEGEVAKFETRTSAFQNFISTHKSGRVVVLNSLCVSKGLQDWVGLQQLLLQLTLSDRDLIRLAFG